MTWQYIPRYSARIYQSTANQVHVVLELYLGIDGIRLNSCLVMFVSVYIICLFRKVLDLFGGPGGGVVLLLYV